MPHGGSDSGRGVIVVWLFLAVIVVGCAAATVEGGGPASAANPGAAEAPPARETPNLVRVVCTDHICGNCDGKCHRNSGHVAVDKKGHCACTPTEGGALDRATRAAYADDPPR